MFGTWSKNQVKQMSHLPSLLAKLRLSAGQIGLLNEKAQAALIEQQKKRCS